MVYYRPEREAQVLNRIKERNEGPLAGEKVAFIFREIMSACLALEKPLQVAYLGPEGTFTQAATIKHFGHAAVCVPQGTIDSVFNQVESGEGLQLRGGAGGELHRGHGQSHPGQLHGFAPEDLRAKWRCDSPPPAGQRPAPRRQIHHRICAHQQALAQCRNWLDSTGRGRSARPVQQR